MKRALWTSLFAVVASAPALAQGISWIEDFQAGLAKAKTEGKPVFLCFYATW
jgi:hypothetical protein